MKSSKSKSKSEWTLLSDMPYIHNIQHKWNFSPPTVETLQPITDKVFSNKHLCHRLYFHLINKKKTKKTISGFLPGTRVSLGTEWLECEKKGRTFMNSWWKNKNENGAGGGSLSAVNEDAVSLPLPTPCLSTLSFFYPHAGLLLSHPLLATRGGSRRLSAPSSLGVS